MMYHHCMAFHDRDYYIDELKKKQGGSPPRASSSGSGFRLPSHVYRRPTDWTAILFRVLTCLLILAAVFAFSWAYLTWRSQQVDQKGQSAPHHRTPIKTSPVT